MFDKGAVVRDVTYRTVIRASWSLQERGEVEGAHSSRESSAAGVTGGAASDLLVQGRERRRVVGISNYHDSGTIIALHL